MGGFSLVELLLSLSLGLALSGVMLQGLMADRHNGARFSRLLRERAAQRRTLELVQHDLAQAHAVSTTPELERHGCSLAGRIPVLHLRTGAGPITYSVGAAPSAIWRGRVLMRCGPAFGLDGLISGGAQSLNRVVIDGLAVKPQIWSGCLTHLASTGSTTVVDVAKSSEQPFSACLDSRSGLLVLRIEQQFGTAQGERVQRIVLEQVIGLGD
ncbi:prepilin-type cleavage/methylation domain-containing protein [Vulcanococcus sp.]|jgi:hypothetical protein|uniref:prepilin-type cleavage/methylation domain-containing protein n=1 Tax=Vulcanococcus sp. TaxID=2856995 RepID=UPI0037DA5133